MVWHVNNCKTVYSDPTKTRRSRRKVKKKELNKTQVINTSHKLQNGVHVYQKRKCIQNHYV